MNILLNLLIVVLVGVCLLMILVILMQKPRQEGLGAAFGGGAVDQLWGAQATNVLQKFTVWMGVSFFVITLAISMILASQQNARQDLGDLTPGGNPGMVPGSGESTDPAAGPGALTPVPGSVTGEPAPLPTPGETVPPVTTGDPLITDPPAEVPPAPVEEAGQPGDEGAAPGDGSIPAVPESTEPAGESEGSDAPEEEATGEQP